MQKRGTDCRLVRIAARSQSDESPPLTRIQQFALAVDAPPLRVLRQAWARAEAVYQEVDTMCGEVAADRRWLSASVVGEVAAPGAETLRMLMAQAGGQFRCSDFGCVSSLRAMLEIGSDGARAVRLLVCGENGSPLERYSAIRSFREILPNGLQPHLRATAGHSGSTCYPLRTGAVFLSHKGLSARPAKA